MTICIPRAVGVFGLPTAPNWFDSTTPGHPELRTVIDDPRWNGAFNRGHGEGTGREAQFRALYMAPDWRGRTSLFLEWQVVYDASADPSDDYLWVGFNNGGGNAADALMLKVVPVNAPGLPLTAVAPSAVQAYTMDPATGAATELPDVPDWVPTFTRIWYQPAPVRWTVHMYVPFDPGAAGLFSDDGIKLPDPFRMFYQLHVKTPTRVTGGAVAGGVVVHKWPLGSADVFRGFIGGSFVDVFPHPATGAQWDEFHRHTGPGDPLCSTAGGVSLDYVNIGNMVDGGAPGITVKFRETTPPPKPVNTLYANVDNQTGAVIPPGGITARFRIADWGSVIGEPNAPWDDVPAPGNPVTNTVNIPTGLAAIGPGSPPPLKLDWVLTNAEIAPYKAGKPSDQCLLVELSGANITFWSDSARRNLLIGPASQLIKTAQISVEGLAPIPGGGPNRDVYVAVETINMPAPPPGDPSTFPATVVWDREKLAALRNMDIGGEVLETLASKGLTEALAMQPSLLETLIPLAPVYRVHVYHDTGRKTRIGMVDYPILHAQTSFGILVDHVGQLTGWEHGLGFGPGVLRDEITPTFSRIHVPENGKIQVSVRVRALEPGEAPTPRPVPAPPGRRLPWWAWLLLLLLLFFLLWLLLR